MLINVSFNWVKRLKGYISRRKLMLKNFLFYLSSKGEFSNERDKRKIILLGTPEYGNIGDQLIAYAELCFLNDNFGENNVLEITENDIRYRFGSICRMIGKDSRLFLQGGGNISDIYCDQENIRNKIITRFPQNEITVMPQTVYISHIKAADGLLKKYGSEILICAREKFSCELLKDCGKNTILCPDITLYLWDRCRRYREEHFRADVGICIRNDEESLEEGLEYRIEEFLKRKSIKSEHFTTVKNHYISASRRKTEINNMLEYISSKQLIITDRLHAMLMAYLTGTPFIAFANSNRKIEGCYEWIKGAQNVYYTSNFEDGLAHIADLIGAENSVPFQFSGRFQKIIERG